MDAAIHPGLGRGRLSVSGNLAVDAGHAGLTLNITAGSLTITLPASYTSGACICIETYSGVQAVTIAFAGALVSRWPNIGHTYSASSITQEGYSSLLLQYGVGGAAFWGVIGGTSVHSTGVASGTRTLTDQATIATDCSIYSTFEVTLGASRTMGAPTNPSAGQRCVWRIKQGGIGSYTITWDAAFRFSTSVPSPTLSTAVGTMDMVGAIYNFNNTTWDVCAVSLGYV